MSAPQPGTYYAISEEDYVYLRSQDIEELNDFLDKLNASPWKGYYWGDSSLEEEALDFFEFEGHLGGTFDYMYSTWNTGSL